MKMHVAAKMPKVEMGMRGEIAVAKNAMHVVKEVLKTASEAWQREIDGMMGECASQLVVAAREIATRQAHSPKHTRATGEDALDTA